MSAQSKQVMEEGIGVCSVKTGDGGRFQISKFIKMNVNNFIHSISEMLPGYIIVAPNYC